MVHTWLRVKNGEVIEDDGPKSMGARHFRRAEKYCKPYILDVEIDRRLDVYIGTKYTYDSLWAVAAKVIRDSGTTWIRNINMDAAEDEYAGITYSSIEKVMCEFGYPLKACKKLVPFKERNERGILRTHVFYYHTGVAKMIAVETDRFYYVFCYSFM